MCKKLPCMSRRQNDNAGNVSSRTDKHCEGPYDRGWAWVVALAVALWNMLIAGSIKSFGILYVEWLELYGESPSTTGWIGSLFTLFLMIGAPVSGCVSDRYSMLTARRTVFVGGLVVTSSMALTGWMPSAQAAMLTYGVVSGIACAAIDTPILNLLSQYFRRYRVLANGLGFSGSSIGGLLLPLIMAWAIHEYSVRGAMLVLGGLCLHVVLVAAVMRPIPLQDVLKVEDDMTIHMVVDEGLVAGYTEKENQCDAQVKDTPKVLDCPSIETVINKFPSGEAYADQSTEESQTTNSRNHCTESLDTEAGSEAVLSMKEESHQLRDLPPGVKLLKALKDYCDFLRTPQLPCLMLTAITASFAYYNNFFVIPPLAEELGMSKYAASSLLALLSVTELISRILVGILADRLKSHKHRILFVSFTLSFILGHLVSFFPSPEVLHAYAVMFGLVGGAFAPMLIPLTVELVPTERIGSATGLFPFVTGTGMSLGPPIMGAIYEYTGTYSTCLIACAAGYGVALVFLSFNLTCCRVRCAHNTQAGTAKEDHILRPMK